MALALGVPTGQAQTVVTDGGTRTGVVAASNGVPVVDIAAPNGKGLSHNTYQQFNVGSNGLILNNSGAVSNTQLAGYVGGNPNLGAGQAASLILNEVTSTAPSQLNGAMEVAGRAAQVVVANPNGITCSGCGFINAPRGTLTSGRPLFAGDGSLGGLAVTGGTITIEGSGLPGTAADQVDLLARAVAINAGVWARQLNVVTGSNQVDFSTLATQPLSATGATPSVALDVSALGGMYANAIRLVGTEAGLGVNSQGEIVAQHGDLTLTSAGQVVLAGKAVATGSAAITSAQSLWNQGTLAAGGTVTLGSENFTNLGVLYGGDAITLSATGAVGNSGQIEAQGDVTLTATGVFDNAASGSLYAGGAFGLTAASLGNAGILESARGAMLRLDGAANNRGLLQVDAGDFAVQAAAIDNGGTLSVGGNAALDAAVSLGNTGTLLTSGQLTLTAPRLVTSGAVQAGTALTLRGDTLTNGGKLYALGGGWAATLTGAFANQADGDVYASRDLAVQAGSLANAGGIEAKQAGVFTLGGDFSNSGRLQTDQADLTLSAVSLANTGTLSAFGKLQWRVGGIARNSGLLVSGGAIDGTSGSFANLVGGQLQGGAGLALVAADLSNAGNIGANGDAKLAGSSLGNAAGAQLIAAGALTLGQTGIVGNAGVLQAGTDLAMTQAAALDNAADATVYAGHDLDLGVAGALTNAGMVYAANAASLAAGSVANTGTLRSAGSLSLASQGNLASSGAVQAQQALNLQGGGDFANSGKLYAIDGVLDVRLGGAFNATASSDVYGGASVMFASESFANDGVLEAKLAAGITAAGDVGNHGTLQVDDGDLVIAGGALSNQGTLSVAGAMQLTSTGSLVNDGQLVTGQALGLAAGSVANGGQIQSGGDATLQSAAIVNSGLLQAGGSLGIGHNTTLTNQSGGSLLAAGDVSADTSWLLTNAGVIQAGGNLAVNGAGAVDNSAGATLYGTRFTTLRLGGGLHNAGAVYGTQGVELMVGSLDNTGSLRSGATLDVTTRADAGNAGTVYAVGAIDWNLGGALANTGVLAANGNVTLKAASLDGNGTLAAGLQADGTLGGAGDLAIATTGNLAAYGRSLAAGGLRFAGSAIDLSGSQTRAGNVTLTASQGDVTNTDGDLAANGTLAITTRASLVNGGATAAQGGKISAGSLVLHAGALDNRYGSLIQTGADDLVLSLTGAFTNANGTLATNAHNLTLNAAEVDNTAGTIQDAGDGMLTITTPGDLANNGGRIAGNGALALQANGVLGNAGGLLSIAGNVTATAGSFANAGGTLVGQDLDLAVVGALTNTAGGTIQAGGALQLGTGSLDNTGGAIKVTGTRSLNLTATGALTNGVDGFIGGNGAATINADSLVNAGQIYAGGMLGVTTQGRLANDGGALQAQDAASIVSGGSLDNRGGRIEAGNGNSAAGLNLRMASLDNTAGRIANAGQGTSTFTITQDAVNQGGTLGGQGAVVLTAVSLDNSQAGKLLAGQALMLGLGSLDNTNGSIYAASDLDWANTSASLQNARGSLQSGGSLTLDLAALDNAGGTIATNQDGSLSLGRLTGLGTVAAGQDLVLTLGSDYTNVAGSQLSANRDLTLNVAGNFGNAIGATLQAVNRLAINAANIDNAAGATLNSATTVLTTGGALTNEGSIAGDTVTLDAESLTNTANIISGTLTVTAGSLTNGADLGTVTDNNPYQGALIAAANSLDLYVSGTLLNRDAALFTLGNLTIGANADGGYSQAVTNLSGDIEAGGNVAINAGQFTNQRRVFQTTTYYLGITEQAQNTTTGEALARYLFSDTNPNHQPPNVTAAQMVGSIEFAEAKAYCDARIGDNARCIGYPNGSGAPTNFQSLDTYAVTAVTRLQAVSGQSKLLAGGDVTLNGSVLNDASTIAAGNNLVINGQDGGMGGGNTSTATVRNVAWAPTAQVVVTTELQTESQYLVHGPRRWVDGGWWTYGTVADVQQLSLAQGSKPTWVTYDAGAGVAASMTAGNAVSITARTIDNTVVDASGNPVQAAISLGANGDVQAVGGTTADAVVRVAGTGGSTSGVAVGGTPDQVGGVPLVLVAAHDASSAPVDKAGTSQSLLAVPQVIATLVGPNAEVRLPQSGLYTVKVQPGSPFLVETNPRFTQYNNFISSDYLLQQLGLNPAQIRQRLGDGFYEQQLVLDQITGLTGRRYLTDNTDALNQYRTLLGNAVEVARQFDLAVGVALTPEQMAGLTRDIVWLVNVTVDGHQVLEPVVYLSTASAQSLPASGATMAGKNVILDATGNLTNHGSIAARQGAQLTASNLLNSGTIGAGHDLSIAAAQDILNGGTISAGGNVSVVAGNDVLSGVSVAQGLGAVNLGGLGSATGPAALPALALPGGIIAGGNLLVGAGRDLALDTAPVSAGANLSLVAGRDLTATAAAITAGGDAQLLAGRDLGLLATASTNRTGTAHNGVETTLHIVDAVQAGGNLSLLAGHDLTSQGAQFDGTTLNLAAGHDVNLAAVTGSITRTSQDLQGRTVVTASRTDEATRGTTLTGADGIAVAAGHDLAITAGQLGSTNGNVSLLAGHDLTLDAAQESHSTTRETVTRPGNFLSGSRKFETQETTDTLLAKGTQITSAGDIDISAGGDLLAVAATMQSSQGNIALSAVGNLSLLAASDSVTTTSQRTKSLSGLGYALNSDAGTSRETVTKQTVRVAGDTLQAAGGISVVSGGDQIVQAASLQSSDGTLLASGGTLDMASATEVDAYSRLSTRHNVYYQSMDDRRELDTTEVQTTIAGPALLVANQGVTVDVGTLAGQTQAQAVNAVLQRPGTEWVSALQDRSDVSWNLVEEQRVQTHNHQEGVSGAAGAVIAATVAYFTAGAASALIGQAAGVAAGSGTTFAAAGVGATGATVSAGLANATIAGAIAGGVSSGVGAAAQGRNWETPALHGAITGGLVGNLSDGTYYGNPVKGVETFWTSLSTGNFTGLGEQVLHVATTQAAGQVEAKLAREMGLAPDQLNWLLMGTSIFGNSLLSVGSRYTPSNPNQNSQDNLNRLGLVVEGVNNRGLLGLPFDAADILLEAQGLPDATVRDILRNPNLDNGLNQPMLAHLDCHSLGTMSCSYVGWNVGGVDMNLAATPLLTVAPVGTSGTTISVVDGYGDAVNGFYLGKLINWQANFIYVPFIVGHSYKNYVDTTNTPSNGERE